MYAGFTIANHSLTHPLPGADDRPRRRDVRSSRAATACSSSSAQPVYGFAYPFGTYNERVMDAVREAGHVYARTSGNADHPFPPQDPMAFHPSCHFLAPDFWARYERAREGGVFYFWGHAYEMTTEAMWRAFEAIIASISADPAARWGHIAELFER